LLSRIFKMCPLYRQFSGGASGFNNKLREQG
jgi:hypothetical protein